MRNLKKNKKVTTDDLAIMVAKGFDNMEKDMGGLQKDVRELKKDMGEVKENVKDTHKDILNLGDRFVSYHTFDSLANRVKVLEENKK